MLILTASVTGVASIAQADETKTPPAQKGVMTMDTVKITLRPQRPNAAIDVSRLAPQVTLAEMKQPFIHRIEEAIAKDPF
jgi:hypothetical protein